MICLVIRPMQRHAACGGKDQVHGAGPPRKSPDFLRVIGQMNGNKIGRHIRPPIHFLMRMIYPISLEEVRLYAFGHLLDKSNQAGRADRLLSHNSVKLDVGKR
jgi:hypothetical protein